MGEKAAGPGELQLSSGTGKGALALAPRSLSVSLCPPAMTLPSSWLGQHFRVSSPRQGDTLPPRAASATTGEGGGSRGLPSPTTCAGDRGPMAAGGGERQCVRVDAHEGHLHCC